MARTGVKKIVIYDHGVLLADDVSSFDFEGTGGPTLAVNNGQLTQTFSGGGGAGYAYAEVPSGSIDGSNVTFILAHTPSAPTVMIIELNGAVQYQNASGDYTISGSTITFLSAPIAGSTLVVYYS